MKLSDNKKINRKNKKTEKLPSAEVVELVLVQCNLVDIH